MTDYCTIAEVKAVMPESPLSSSTDADIEAAIGYFITAASRMIDRYVGQYPNFFYPSSDLESRYYDGVGDELDLMIDDCASLSSVAVSESGGISSSDYIEWTLNVDYITIPYNATPIYGLRINRDGGKTGWTNHKKAVKVTGVFGYSLTPPADVKHACITQTVRWFMRAKQAFMDSGAGGQQGSMTFSATIDNDVALILEPYRVRGMMR